MTYFDPESNHCGRDECRCTHLHGPQGWVDIEVSEGVWQAQACRNCRPEQWEILRDRVSPHGLVMERLRNRSKHEKHKQGQAREMGRVSYGRPSFYERDDE
jgi:hypothetical protein